MPGNAFASIREMLVVKLIGSWRIGVIVFPFLYPGNNLFNGIYNIIELIIGHGGMKGETDPPGFGGEITEIDEVGNFM